MRRNPSRRWAEGMVGLVALLAAATTAVVGTSVPAALATPPAGVVATATGWFDQTGFHDALNDNYSVGNVTPLPAGRLRNFFVFDLSGVTGDVVSVTLSAANYGGVGPPATLTLYDVATPAATLTATATGATGVFADLGSGTVYGSLAVANPNASPLSVPFNPSGVTAVQAAAGRTFAIGGDYAPAAVVADSVFGSTGSDFGHPKSDVQLLVTTRPAPWPQFRAGPAHPGSVPATSLITAANVASLTEAWQAPGIGASSPAVVGGVLYGGTNKLYAYEASGASCAGVPKTCAPLWTMTPGGQLESSPAVADGVVYVGGSDGKLYAVDAAGVANCGGSPTTCAPLWTATTGGVIGEYPSSPAVVGGVVYIGSDDGKLYAFDAAGVNGCGGAPKTCAPLWTAATGGHVGSSPAVSGGTVFVGSDDGKLYAFDALGTSGCAGEPVACAPLWTAAVGSKGVFASPAVAGGLAYVISVDGQLAAFDAAGAIGCSGAPKTCSPVWSASTGTGLVFSSPAVAGGVVYVGSADKKLDAFDAAGVTNCTGTPATCVPLWTGTMPGAGATDFIVSSPAVANGLVFVGSDSFDHQLYAFDASGVTGCAGSPKICTPVWTGETGTGIRSSPAIAGGMVYAGSDGPTLHAFGLPQTGAGGDYHPLSPTRILDTRDGTGGIASALGPGATVSVPVAGRGGVPAAGVSAVTVNLAVTQPTSNGYLTIFPTGTTKPLASSINFEPGQTISNMVVAKLGADGTVSVFNPAGATQVVVDVEGWFGAAGVPAGALYNALSPTRLLDTRYGTGGIASPVGPGATVSVPVAGRAGVPAAGVSAVAINLAVTEPTSNGYLTVFPTGTTQPLASSINFEPSQTISNMVMAKLGADGTISVFNPAGATQVVIDVEGWFGATGTPYSSLSPTRILDTRYGSGGIASAVGPGATVSVPVAGRGGVPATGVSAVAINLAVTEPTANGYLTVFPTGTTQPLASSINFGPGQTISNMVVAKLGADGTVSIFNSAGATHVVIDVEGWFG